MLPVASGAPPLVSPVNVAAERGLPTLWAAGTSVPITLRAIVTDTLTWFGLGGLAPRLPIPDLPVPALVPGSLWLGYREVQRTLNNQRPTL